MLTEVNVKKVLSESERKYAITKRLISWGFFVFLAQSCFLFIQKILDAIVAFDVYLPRIINWLGSLRGVAFGINIGLLGIGVILILVGMNRLAKLDSDIKMQVRIINATSVLLVVSIPIQIVLQWGLEANNFIPDNLFWLTSQIITQILGILLCLVLVVCFNIYRELGKWEGEIKERKGMNSVLVGGAIMWFLSSIVLVGLAFGLWSESVRELEILLAISIILVGVYAIVGMNASAILFKDTKNLEPNKYM